MQILPTTASDNYVAAVSGSARDELGFSRLVSQYLDNSPAEVTPSYEDSNSHASPSSTYADSNPHASEQATQPRADEDLFAGSSPYLYTDSTLNPSQVPQEVRFTPAEVNKIADKLEENGADPKAVHAVRQLADSPMGVTAPDIVKAMADAMQPVARLSESDMQRIFTLASRLDRNGSMTDQLMSDIRGGKTGQAWQTLQKGLNAADQTRAITVDRNELLSLAKGLGLSSSTLDALNAGFGGKSQLKLQPEGLRKLLGPMQQEMTERASAQEKLASSLDKAMGPVAKEARIRMQAEQSAFERASRSTEQSQTLIRDTVTRTGLNKLDNTAENVATSGKEVSKQRIAGKGADTGKDVAATKGGAGMSSTELPLAAQHMGHSKDTSDTADKDSRSGADKQRERPTSSAEAKKTDAGWDSLLQRVSMNTSTTDTSLAGQSMSMSSSAQTQQAMPKTGATATTYAPQVLKQVEQGMLSAMRDGSRRLELQLAPSELGVVTVILTSKNGEISALLRPERGETATFLNQQADQLRFTLEQQGIKVDKVEVQTQLQDGRNSMTWQGMDQHNTAQEQQARADENNRMRRIGRLLRTGNDGASLAQDMHRVNHEAEPAVRGLHIVT